MQPLQGPAARQSGGLLRVLLVRLREVSADATAAWLLRTGWVTMPVPQPLTTDPPLTETPETTPTGRNLLAACSPEHMRAYQSGAKLAPGANAAGAGGAVCAQTSSTHPNVHRDSVDAAGLHAALTISESLQHAFVSLVVLIGQVSRLLLQAWCT